MEPTNYKRYFDENSPKQEKIRLIFFPFLLLTAGVIALCGVVYWYLVYEKGMESDSIGLLAIFVSAFAPLLIFRRMNLVERKSDFLNRLVYLTCTVSILIPALCIQSHIERNGGKLTPLNDITEIVNQPPTRFYTIRKPIHTTKLVLDFTYIKSAGDRTSEKILETYCITPIYSQSQSNHIAWLGKIYKSRNFYIGNKQSKIESFVPESTERFERDAQKTFTYLERITLNEDSGYYRALGLFKTKPHEVILLIPHYTPFEDHAGNDLYYALLAYVIGAGLFLLIVILYPLNERRLHCFLTGERYGGIPDLPPSKVVKGKNVIHDKLIFVRGITKHELEKDLKEACDLYNTDGGNIYPHLQQVDDKEFSITFPYDVDFELFCYLINYLYYPTSARGRVEVIGWTKAVADDPWITQHIAGKQIMLYAPEDEKDHDNIYVTTENGEYYTFDFDGGTYPLTKQHRPYQKPITIR